MGTSTASCGNPAGKNLEDNHIATVHSSVPVTGPRGVLSCSHYQDSESSHEPHNPMNTEIISIWGYYHTTVNSHIAESLLGTRPHIDEFLSSYQWRNILAHIWPCVLRYELVFGRHQLGGIGKGVPARINPRQGRNPWQQIEVLLYWSATLMRCEVDVQVRNVLI